MFYKATCFLEEKQMVLIVFNKPKLTPPQYGINNQRIIKHGVYYYTFLRQTASFIIEHSEKY